MCLITAQRKPIITKQDMIVFKYLKVCQVPQYSTTTSYSLVTSTATYNTNYTTEYRSRYRSHTWLKNRLYKTEIRCLILQSSNINNPNYFEFFDSESQFHYLYRDKKLPLFLVSISEGFHFSLNKDRFNHSFPSEIFSFKVPAGSEVFYDETELGVTNQIIFIG